VYYCNVRWLRGRAARLPPARPSRQRLPVAAAQLLPARRPPARPPAWRLPARLSPFTCRLMLSRFATPRRRAATVTPAYRPHVTSYRVRPLPPRCNALAAYAARRAGFAATTSFTITLHCRHIAVMPLGLYFITPPPHTGDFSRHISSCDA